MAENNTKEMLALRLNSIVQRDLSVFYTAQTGLHCVLDFPARSLLTKSGECERYQRLEEAKHRELVTKAAVKIQTKARVYLAKKQLSHLKWLKEQARIRAASICIQKHCRRILAQRQLQILRTARAIMTIRSEAVYLIQRCYRAFHARLAKLTSKLKRIRQAAAIFIQKHVRGYLTRRDLAQIQPLLHSKKRLLIWHSQAKKVFFTGTITEPPWKIHVQMKYSHSLGEFYSTYLCDRPLAPGTYLLKFIVDGQWVCDGHYPIQQDAEGNFNNVITVHSPIISRTNSSASIQKSRHKTETHSDPALNPNLHQISPNPYREIRSFPFSMTGHSQHSGTGEITDAHFTNLEDLSFGIADEPRESAHLGAGHRAYALELVQNCDRFISENVRKADSGTSSSEICRISLDQAHTSCQNYGSSSVLIGLFRQRRLSLAYLGSSSVLVLRAQTSSSLSIIYRSAPQRHGFSSPYQLPHLPLGPDSASPVPGEIARTPLSPVCYVDVSLEPGDVVVAGSDGLFDNLFDLGIVTLAERRMGSGISPSAFTNSLARALVDSAVRKGADPAYKSPFAKQARLEGHVYVGGRRDDVTAIVTVVGGLI